MAPEICERDAWYEVPADAELTTSSREARLRRAIALWFDLVWRTLRGLGISSANADDATQLAFITLSDKLERVPQTHERAFLVGVAIRIAANERRVRRRHPEDPSDRSDDMASSQQDPEQQLDTKQALTRLKAMLARMSDEQRTVFVLFELEGFKIVEIAEMLELPAGTVASRLRGARQVFERALAVARANTNRLEGRQ